LCSTNMFFAMKPQGLLKITGATAHIHDFVSVEV
jgi:hypothetical protein